MTKKFKTLFLVKSSLVSLYIALTVPIPFICNENLKIPSLIFFILGLFMIINITSDYVVTCDKKICYKTNFISRVLGKKNWEICWEEIKSIKSLPTSQGSKVFYFVDEKGNNLLVPQRIEDFEIFLDKVKNKANISIEGISYISPLWTYNLLTVLSVLMIIGEISLFLI